MNFGLSDKVRDQARTSYVLPAKATGNMRFAIPVKELIRKLEEGGFPANHARQVCMALSSGKFLRENNLEVENIDGPPSKTSTTVVVRYRVADSSPAARPEPGSAHEAPAAANAETPEEWAHRLAGKLQGLLKDEIAELGGAEKFIRWVRGYDEEESA